MGAMTVTHEVTNQPPPLEGYDVFGADAALVEAVEREGAGWAGRRPLGARPPGRVGRGRRLGLRRQPPPARAAHPRPLRPPGRRGRLPPRLPRADAGGRWATACTGRRGRSTGPAPTWPGPPASSPGRRSRRARLPDVDDLLGRPRPAAGARPGRRVGAPAGGPGLRPPRRPRPREGRRHRRHGHDREAGRLRRAGQHHPGRARRRRRLAAHRAQVVLLGPDVRRVPDAGPGPGACPASSCPAGCPTASATPASASSG